MWWNNYFDSKLECFGIFLAIFCAPESVPFSQCQQQDLIPYYGLSPAAGTERTEPTPGERIGKKIQNTLAYYSKSFKIIYGNAKKLHKI